MSSPYMDTIELKKHLPTSLITHAALKGLLQKSYSKVNDKIANLVEKGELISLKKGFYVFSQPYRTSPLDMIAVANGLYAPSYVSFEYALSLHGMIPERVSEITSATFKNNKLYSTPIGRFSYQKIPMKAYPFGIDWHFDEVEGGRFIATPEKALCDKIRYDRGIGTLSQTQMLDYLYEDLRIDLVQPLDVKMIEVIAEAYRSRNLKTLAILLKKGKL